MCELTMDIILMFSISINIVRFIIDRRLMAHLPDKVVVSLNAEPCLKYIPDAETFVLTSEEAPCALQL